MKRPLFIFLLFLIEGIIIGRYFKFNLTFLIILALNIFIVIYIYKIYKLKLVYIYIFSFLLGYFLLKNNFNIKNDILNSYINSKEEFIIECNVKSINYTKNNKQKVIFKVKKLYLKRKEFHKKIYLLGILDREENINIGQNLKLKGKILPLSHKKNPQDIDEFIYLKARNIDYKIFPKIIEKGEIKSSIYKVLNKVKIKLSKIYDEVLPLKESSIVKSMILAEKTDLDSNIINLYRISGIYHLLVISGLHITILVLFLQFLLKKFINNKLSYIIIILFITLYSITVGSNISTVRAVIMASLVLFGKLIYKESDFITTISFSAISILLYNPLYLWDIGFNLSFIIVFSIAFCTNSMNRLYSILFRKIKIFNFLLQKHKLRDIISVSTVVSLYISPILSYYFFYINPYSLIVNLIIVPTSTIVVILGFILGIIGLINVHISQFLSGGLVILLKIYEIICKIFVRLPFSNILVGRINIIFILLFYLIVSFLFYIILDSKKFIKNIKYFKFLVIFYIVLILFSKIFNNNMEITFLNVGKGESAVINLKNEVYIIDGGGLLNKEIGENVGEKVVKTFLDYKGINNIDAIFLTSLNKEHILGIIELISLKNVKKIIMPYNIDYENSLYLTLEKELKKYKTPLKFVDNNYKLISKKGINIEVLYPFYEERTDSKNNRGNMVLKVTYKDIKTLFASSIKTLEENLIINKYEDISANILKMPFGKNIEKDENKFIELVNPVIAIYNQKYNNFNKLEEPIKEYKNIDIYNTKEDNAIIIKIKGKKIFLYKTKGED